MPSLAGATRWINGEPRPEALEGRLVLVQFWAVSCSICKDNLPVLRRCKEQYGPRGLAVISVHMPRQESDTWVEGVETAVRAYGMDEPVAIDNAHVIGERFETEGLWPLYFLFDRDGRLRTRAAGAAGLSIVESSLRRLLDEARAA
jgi:hypothetical protein